MRELSPLDMTISDESFMCTQCWWWPTPVVFLRSAYFIAIVIKTPDWIVNETIHFVNFRILGTRMVCENRLSPRQITAALIFDDYGLFKRPCTVFQKITRSFENLNLFIHRMNKECE